MTTKPLPPQHGGCLCSALRYAVTTEPVRVTICHCKFCQRATGGAYFVEPIFERASLKIISGTPKTYDHDALGEGRRIIVHFCATCGTKTHLAFERFPDIYGVYAGTFDDPDWFERSAKNSRHIFVETAQRGTVIPAEIDTFPEHAAGQDLADAQSDHKPHRYDAPYVID